MDFREASLKPIVSICIANYNGDAVLEGCVSSVMAQITDFPVEILIHDDCSSDDSVAILKERYPSCTPLVRGPERKYGAQLDELGGTFDVCLESLGGKYLSSALDRISDTGVSPWNRF